MPTVFLFNELSETPDACGRFDYDPNNPDHIKVVYTVTSEGFKVDTGSGEIVGHVDAEVANVAPAFTEDEAAWVLRLMRDKEARLVGAKAEQAALLASVKSNTDPHINHLARGLAWLEATYRPKLEAFAASKIAETNAGKPESKWVRSWRCAYGLLQLVANKAGSVAVKKGYEQLAEDVLRKVDPAGLVPDVRAMPGKERELAQAVETYGLERYAVVMDRIDLARLGAEERAALFATLGDGTGPVVTITSSDGTPPKVTTLADVFDFVQPGSDRMDIRTGARAPK